jgi:hypothetical protein
MTHRLNRAEIGRFMREVRVPKDWATDCWIWEGKQYPNGYPKFSRGPGHLPRAAHRIIWEHYNNMSVPEGMQLGHTCHDEALAKGECDGGDGCQHRQCVNPRHTAPQSPSENTLLSNHFQRRKTHCPRGHEYTEENTNRRNGRRYCRKCERIRKRGTS